MANGVVFSVPIRGLFNLTFNYGCSDFILTDIYDFSVPIRGLFNLTGVARWMIGTTD